VAKKQQSPKEAAETWMQKLQQELMQQKLPVRRQQQLVRGQQEGQLVVAMDQLQQMWQ
jgi:hypothetical protein